MKLTLSTLTCPSWTLAQIVDQCIAHGITGIDFRGLGPAIDITHLPEFTDHLPDTLAMLKANGISMPCLNTSVVLVTPDADRWATMISETKRTAKLAERTSTPMLRVFGGAIPHGMARPAAAELGKKHLRELVKICSDHSCIPVLETHDDWAPSERVLQLLGEFDPADAAVLWDLEHPWKQGEAPDVTAAQLRPWIRHVHVKDIIEIDGENHPAVIGQGKMPLNELFAALRSIEYDGWLCLESEKRWDPLAPEPEVNLPAFAAVVASC